MPANPSGVARAQARFRAELTCSSGVPTNPSTVHGMGSPIRCRATARFPVAAAYCLLPLDEVSAAAWLPLHYLDLGREDTCNPSTYITRSTKILAIRSAGRDRIVSCLFGRATVAMALCQPEGRWLTVELLETRHVRAAFKAMPAKTDRTDQLMRLGWFRPVYCKSLPAREVRALLTIRKLLQAKRSEIVPRSSLALLYPRTWANEPSIWRMSAQAGSKQIWARDTAFSDALGPAASAATTASCADRMGGPCRTT